MDKIIANQKNKKGIDYLVDNFAFESITAFKDEKTGKEIHKFRARVQQADKTNLNLRYYEEDALIEAVDYYQKKIDAKQSFMLLDHPDWFSGGSHDRVIAIVTSITYDKASKFVFIEGEFVKNKLWDEVLKPIIDAGGIPAYSVRGYCPNSTDSNRNPVWDDTLKAYRFKKGYRIGGYDLVTEPAMEDATTVAMENLNPEPAPAPVETPDKTKITDNKNLKGETRMEPKVYKTLAELKADYPALLKETDDIIAKLTADNAKLGADLNTANQKLAMIQDEHAKTSAQLADMQVKVECEKMLKDNAFAKYITIPATIKTVADAKSYIEAETAKLTALKNDVVATTKTQDAAPVATPAPVAPVSTPAVPSANVPADNAFMTLTDAEQKCISEYDEIAQW